MVKVAILRVLLDVDEKVFELGVVVLKLFHESHGVGEIVKVLKVNLEKTDLFLDVLEDNFIVPVASKVIMKDDKEVLIEFAYSIDVRKQYINLICRYDFGVEELHLKVAYYQT